MNVTNSRLIQFLQEELALPADSLAIAQRSAEQDRGPVPMILWQYGLITLEELDRIYDSIEEL
jgi:Protein of unknown function (DUF2949)